MVIVDKLDSSEMCKCDGPVCLIHHITGIGYAYGDYRPASVTKGFQSEIDMFASFHAQVAIAIRRVARGHPL